MEEFAEEHRRPDTWKRLSPAADRRGEDALRARNAPLEATPATRPSITLVRRIESRKANPLPEDRDGYRHIEK